jgi:hypothetical protein
MPLGFEVRNGHAALPVRSSYVQSLLLIANQGCNHLAAARAGAGYRLHCDGRTESLPVAFQRSPPSDEIERTLLETFGVSGVCPKGETIGG